MATPCSPICAQRLGVGAVGAFAVLGDAAGTGRIVDQRAARRLDPRQAARNRAEAAGEGIVAAGVEQHQIDAGLRVFHVVEHRLQAEALLRDVLLAFDQRVDRRQVVLAADLQAVAGIEEQRDLVGADQVAEFAERGQDERRHG